MKTKPYHLIIVLLLMLSVQSCAPKKTAMKPDLKTTKIPYDVFCPTQNEAAKALFNRAVNAAKQSGRDKAKELYQSAIQLDPNYCDAMDNLGVLLRSEGRLDEAIGWYQKSIEIFPQNTVAQTNLAFAYRAKGDNFKAIEAYKAVVEIDDKDPEGYYGLGTIYFGEGEYQKAVEQFLNAESRYKEKKSGYETHAQFFLGQAYFKLGDCLSAIKYFELAYRELHEDPYLNFNLGLCYMSKEAYDIEKARIHLNKAESLGVKIKDEIKQLL